MLARARARAHTQVRARPDESRSALGVGAQGLETVVLTGLSALSHRPSFSATPVPALEAHGVGRRLSQGCRDLSGEAALPSLSRSSLQPSGAPTHGLFLGHCVTAGEGEAGRIKEEGVWRGHSVLGSPSSLHPRHPALRQPHLVLRPNFVSPQHCPSHWEAGESHGHRNSANPGPRLLLLPVLSFRKPFPRREVWV